MERAQANRFQFNEIFRQVGGSEKPVPPHVPPLREEEKFPSFSEKKVTELFSFKTSLSSLRPTANPAVTNPALSPVPSGYTHTSGRSLQSRD